jgi:hypothetical protein
MTPEDWKTVEQKLSFPFGMVVLKADGYEVALRVEPVKRLQYQIMAYVDGQFKGKWTLEDCEIRRKFMRPRTTYAFPTKDRRALKKLGRTALSNMGIDPDRRITYYTPLWTSPRTLKTHLRKNCQNIELVE